MFNWRRQPARLCHRVFNRRKINRNASPDDYHVPDSNDVTLDQQQTLCVILCNILYWKTVCLRISFAIYIIGTIVVACLLGYAWI